MENGKENRNRGGASGAGGGGGKANHSDLMETHLKGATCA